MDFVRSHFGKMNLWPVEHFFEHICHHFWVGLLLHPPKSDDKYTTSWGCWKHPFGIPGVRPMFLKPKLHKESKNGFKTINYRRYPVMIFSKNCFRSKKIIKKVGRFVDFWIFMAICMAELDQFKKNNCRTFRISWNITKMLKTEHLSSYVTLFLKIKCLRSRKAYCS